MSDSPIEWDKAINELGFVGDGEFTFVLDRPFPQSSICLEFVGSHYALYIINGNTEMHVAQLQDAQDLIDIIRIMSNDFTA